MQTNMAPDSSSQFCNSVRRYIKKKWESPKMERLPGEMVAEIGRYLSVADLAACSATCRTWREMFNDGRIWRRRCTLRLVEYLENTDTTVSPGLKLTEHDSLSPMSEWRTRFIRENHLWNNWRAGNFDIHQIACVHEAKTTVRFYGNDYIVMVLNSEVQLWDVRDVPTCLMINPCELDVNSIVDYFQILSEDRILFVQLSKVSVFRMSVTSSHWPLIHSFHFDERLPTTRYSNASNIKSPRPREDGIITVPEIHFYIVNGDYFIGVAPDYTRLLHVWNIKTGNKLKEVVCPVRSPNSYFTRIYRSRRPSPDVLLVVEEYPLDERSLQVWTHLYVYNVTELRFRDFTHSRAGRRISLFKFKIYDPYVFIKDFFYLNIYNYKTSTLVDIKPAVSNPIVFNNNLVYVAGRKFMEFNVSTERTNELSSFEGYAVFFIACDRFIAQPLSMVDFEVLEFGRRQTRRENVIEANNHHWLSERRANTNVMCTKKIIVEFDQEENKVNVYLFSFW